MSLGGACTPGSLASAATVWDRDYGDTGIPVAGPGRTPGGGVPDGRGRRRTRLSSDAGRGGTSAEAVELRHRLPALWRRLPVATWRRGKTAASPAAPSVLTREAAAYVDAHVAHIAQKIGPYQLARLIEEAIARFMPGEAETPPGRRRRTTLWTSTPATPCWPAPPRCGASSTSPTPLDLDAAVTAGAERVEAPRVDRLPRRTPCGGGSGRWPAPADLDLSRDTGPARQTEARRAAAEGASGGAIAHLSDAAIIDARSRANWAG